MLEIYEVIVRDKQFGYRRSFLIQVVSFAAAEIHVKAKIPPDDEIIAITKDFVVERKEL